MSDQDSTQIAPTVYFIRFGESGPIKIGKTSGGVSKRLSELQCGSPETLYLMATISDPVCGYTEADLHKRFDHLWIRGEWFDSAKELTDFIVSNATPFPFVVQESPIPDRPVYPSEMVSWDQKIRLAPPSEDYPDDIDHLGNCVRCAIYVLYDKIPIEDVCEWMDGISIGTACKWITYALRTCDFSMIFDPDGMIAKRMKSNLG